MQAKCTVACGLKRVTEEGEEGTGVLAGSP